MSTTQQYTTTTGQTVDLPPHEEYYKRLVTRNAGVVPPDEQRRIREARILVAGCGSIGGSVIEPLIRFGAEHLTLAEPDGYDFHNMNRQSVRLQDVGVNRAAAFQTRLKDVNPYATIEVEPHGITDDNVVSLVKNSDLILDGVDVTNKPPLYAKYALHHQAKELKVPVISGYDIAGLQLLLVYDYRNPAMPVLNGKLRREELDGLEPMTFLHRIVPTWLLPYEIIEILHHQFRNPGAGFPQVVYTANLFGAMAMRAGADILMSRPVKHLVHFDVHDVMRPLPQRLALHVKRVVGLIKLYVDFKKRFAEESAKTQQPAG